MRSNYFKNWNTLQFLIMVLVQLFISFHYSSVHHLAFLFSTPLGYGVSMSFSFHYSYHPILAHSQWYDTFQTGLSPKYLSILGWRVVKSDYTIARGAWMARNIWTAVFYSLQMRSLSTRCTIAIKFCSI